MLDASSRTILSIFLSLSQMILTSSRFVSCILLTTSFFLTSTDIRRVSAFAAAPNFTAKSLARSRRATSPSLTVQHQQEQSSTALRNSNNIINNNNMSATPSTKKMRITAFDSMRAVLCVMIVLGHFISFANPSPFWLRFFSQHNTVPVAAFFLLSGYVAAYTCTENGQRTASPKLLQTPKPQWILSRIFGYYPLHLLTLLLFSPMFIYTDLKYNGPWTAALHGTLSVTLTTAWFATKAEVWNAPTWYLSALTFATCLMPYALPVLARQDKCQLRKTTFWLWLTSLLPKLGYCLDCHVWTVAEGITAPKLHPNLLAFNTQRFAPLHAVTEILLGAAACRLVMLDSCRAQEEEEEKKTTTTVKAGTPKVNVWSTVVPLVSILAVMVLRASGVWQVNDLLVRTVLIVPAVLRLFMGVHRAVLQGAKDPLTGFLSHNKVLTWFAKLAFPIYIVHGPIGQVFYKKIIATALWGKVLKGPEWFALYLATTTLTAFLLQQFFLQSKVVQRASKEAVAKLSAWM